MGMPPKVVPFPGAGRSSHLTLNPSQSEWFEDAEQRDIRAQKATGWYVHDTAFMWGRLGEGLVPQKREVGIQESDDTAEFRLPATIRSALCPEIEVPSKGFESVLVTDVQVGVIYLVAWESYTLQGQSPFI